MKTPAQQVCDLLKLEIEVLCDPLHGAAYNCIYEDDREMFELVRKRLVKAEIEAKGWDTWP